MTDTLTIRNKIPETNRQRVVELIEHLNKRAAKLDMAPLTLTVHGHEDRVIDRTTGRIMRYYDLEVTGQAPVLTGWHVAGMIDHSGDLNIISQPAHSRDLGLEIPEHYRKAGPNCDHCGYDRYRLTTVLLWNEDDGWKQVGRTCLKDFGANAHLLRQIEWANSLYEELEGASDPEFYGGSWRADRFDLAAYLGHVAAAIDERGWLSRGKARDEGRSGSDTATTALDSLETRDERKRLTVTDEHKADAAAAIEWARTELAESDSLNDYEWNLVSATAEDSFHNRHVGLVASLMPAFYRASGRWGASGQTDEPERFSEHVGTMGERGEWALTVETEIPVDTQYGYSLLYLMRDPDGNVFKWFTSSAPVPAELVWPDREFDGDPLSQYMEVGWTYRMKGTIKAHEDYNGTLQTALSRCKVLSIIERPETDREEGN